MAAPPRVSYEVRTRATFFLPITDADEERAIIDVIRYLEQQRIRKRISVTGYTHSRLRTPVFRGGWWKEEETSPHPPHALVRGGGQKTPEGEWVREGVVLFIVDYLSQIGNRALDQALARLRQAIAKAYSIMANHSTKFGL
jgi:hypothetical protein